LSGIKKVIQVFPALTQVAIDFSSGDAQTIVAAPGAGKRIRVVSLDLTAATSVEVAVKSGTTTIRTFQFTQHSWDPLVPQNLGTNEALVLDATTADRITGGVGYYVETV
jgi:hypothetical protein